MNTKDHLYETAFNGFYEYNPDVTVNLVPKNWTKYTVTDGDWMSYNTLIPLVNRDIFLANTIDKIYNYNYSLYNEGNYIIIDKETNTISISVLPFEYEYNFIDGIIEDNYYVSLELLKSNKNKLTATNSGISYNVKSGTYYSAYLNPDTDREYKFSAGLTNNSISSIPENANIVMVTNATYKYDNRYSDSGLWYSGTDQYWNYNTKHIETSSIYVPHPVVSSDLTASGSYNNIFSPNDNSVFDEVNLTGGSNYITNNTNMIPNNILYIYD